METFEGILCSRRVVPTFVVVENWPVVEVVASVVVVVVVVAWENMKLVLLGLLQRSSSHLQA